MAFIALPIEVNTVPIGVLATREFVEEVGKVANVDVSALLERERAGTAQVDASRSLLPWYSRSVDSTYLTGKRVFVFGDATHVMAAARMAKDELGFTVVGIGTYSREYARPIRDLAAALGVEALISDDYLAVEQRVTELAPELVLGTQMERHIAKRLGVPLWKLWGLDAKAAPRSTFTIGIAPDAETLRSRVRDAAAYPILKIKLGSSWDREVLRQLGPDIDHLSLHRYARNLSRRTPRLSRSPPAPTNRSWTPA